MGQGFHPYPCHDAMILDWQWTLPSPQVSSRWQLQTGGDWSTWWSAKFGTWKIGQSAPRKIAIEMGKMMIKHWIFEDLIFGPVLPWTTKNMGWMGFKITMMPSFRTRNLFDSFVLLGEGRDMVEVSQLMFDDLWMAMLGPWVHACIHHSHLSTTHWVIRLHFLHQSFGRSIASVRDISGESEACGSGMFPLLRFWCWMIFAYFCGCEPGLGKHRQGA